MKKIFLLLLVILEVGIYSQESNWLKESAYLYISLVDFQYKTNLLEQQLAGDFVSVNIGGDNFDVLLGLTLFGLNYNITKEKPELQLLKLNSKWCIIMLDNLKSEIELTDYLYCDFEVVNISENKHMIMPCELSFGNKFNIGHYNKLGTIGIDINYRINLINKVNEWNLGISINFGSLFSKYEEI